MIRPRPQAALRALPLAVLALIAALIVAAPVRAADPAPASAAAGTTPPALSAADRAQAAALAKTLEDPVERDKLIAQLKLMSEAEKPAAQPAASAGVLRDLFQTLEAASDTLVEAATEIANIGELADWLSAQADDPRAQMRVFRVVVRLITVFVAGLIVEWILGRLLRRPIRFVESRPIQSRWVRLPFAVVRWIFDLVPVAGFAASAYAMLAIPFYRPGGHSELVSVAVITAYALSAGIGTFIKAVFEPQYPSLRVVPLREADAERLTVWARRLARTAVWGYYADEVLRLLGLPQVGFESLLKLLGLALAIMVVMVVIEFRRSVSQWIRGDGAATAEEARHRAEFNRRVAGMRRGLAEVWHILAMLYILAAFVVWALRVEGGFEFLLRATLLSAAILVAARIVTTTLFRLAERSFAPHTQIAPSVAVRRRRYHRMVRSVIMAIVMLLALIGILAAWGADSLEWLGSDIGHRIVGAAATILIVIVIAVVVWEAVTGSIERYLAQTDSDGKLIARSARARTLLPLMRNAFTVLLIVIAALVVLEQIGIDIGPFLAGAGVIGVAIGFGSQKLVQDVITGAFILFEDTISVGDYVVLGNLSGTVEAINIRTIVLRAYTGQLHTIPFSSVTTISNISRDFGYYVTEVGVSYREDLDEVMKVIRAVGEEVRADPAFTNLIIDPLDIWGVDRFGDSAIIIMGRFKTVAGQHLTVGREFNRRLKRRFDELGIEMPFPHRTIYFGEDRQGRAPPARIRMEMPTEGGKPDETKPAPPAEPDPREP
jgi:small conductance mechanosensitive channel